MTNEPETIWIVLIQDHEGRERGDVFPLPADEGRNLIDRGVAMPATDFPKLEEPQE